MQPTNPSNTGNTLDAVMFPVPPRKTGSRKVMREKRPWKWHKEIYGWPIMTEGEFLFQGSVLCPFLVRLSLLPLSKDRTGCFLIWLAPEPIKRTRKWVMMAQAQRTIKMSDPPHNRSSTSMLLFSLLRSLSSSSEPCLVVQVVHFVVHSNVSFTAWHSNWTNGNNSNTSCDEEKTFNGFHVGAAHYFHIFFCVVNSRVFDNNKQELIALEREWE